MLSPNTVPISVCFLITATSTISSILITIFAVSFTPPTSLLRPALLPLHLYLLYITYIYTRVFTDLTLAPFFIGTQGGYIIHFVEVALISCWSFETYGPTTSRGGVDPITIFNPQDESQKNRDVPVIAKLRFGFWVSCQTRFPATKWAVKNIPPFSYKDRGYIPRKSTFLLSRLVKLVIYSLALDIMSFANNSGKDHSELFTLQHIPLFARLPEVSGHEVGLRVVMAIMPFVFPFFMLDMFYCLVSIGGVIIGMDVEEWPPFFGQLTRLTSIRKFWGEVWHQMLRRKAGSPAHFVTYNVLKLRKGSIIGRYTCILLTFAISGVLHIWIDMALGISWHESGAMRFFCMQTIGIAIEDAVHATLPSVKGDGQKSRSWILGVLGFLWFLAWMSWSMPIWIYPTLQWNTEMKLLPFTFIGSILKA